MIITGVVIIAISIENGKRICAALKYFSETSTKEIKRLAYDRFKK